MIKKRNKILIIDDATELVGSLAILLESHEYEVQKAPNGKLGLKKLETYEPDLIFLDMDMPVMGGIEFYHTFLAQNGGKCKYPILVFTGRESLENVFKDLEVEGFMTKPFDFDELLEKVNSIFQKRYGHQKPSAEPPSLEQLEKTPLDSVLIFEPDVSVFDAMVIAFANEDTKAEAGLSGDNIPEHTTIENAIHRIKTKNSAAALIRIQSLNPLHSSYNWIKPVFDIAKEKNIPVIFYTSESIPLHEDIKAQILKEGAVTILATLDAGNLTRETFQAVRSRL